MRQLRYLVTVADTRHFRRAAELCNVSQPTLSDQIRVLEQRLNVQLIERSRHRVVLTPVGKEIADRARRVLRDVQDILDLAERGRHLLDGTLRLGVLPSLGPYLLPLILPYLHRRYPELTIYLREDSAEQLLRRLTEGDLELLIYALPARGDEYVSEKLFREPLWLAVPKAHSLADRNDVSAVDLKGVTILALEPGHSLHQTMLLLGARFGARVRLDYATTSLDTLRHMAGLGMGATFLPALYVRAEARQDPHLRCLPLLGDMPSRDIGIVWRQRSARDTEYRALATHIREVLAADVPEVQVIAPGC